MKDGLKRKRRAGAMPVAPIWFLSDDVEQRDRAFAERIPTGGMVADSPLGLSGEVPFGSAALLRLDPDLGLKSWFRPAVGTDLPITAEVLPEGLVLLRPNTGRMAVTQGARRVTARARDAVLVSGALPVTVRLSDVDRLDCLEVAEREVSVVMAASAAALTVIERDNPALALLGNYGAALMRGLLPVSTGSLRDHAMRHMAGLVGIMCAEPVGLSRQEPANRQADRMAGMKADIEARLDHHGLTAKRFAEFHGLSVRTLQKHFEAEGRTFSQFVLERRLERAMRLLRRSIEEQRSISEVAFSVGFGDLSYFNRTFRKRFGIAPRQARAQRDRSDVPSSV